MTNDGMTGPRALLVDVHAHFVTGEYVSAASVAGHEQPDGDTWRALTTRNAERLLRRSRPR
jgi:hypothetical protein